MKDQELYELARKAHEVLEGREDFDGLDLFNIEHYLSELHDINTRQQTKESEQKEGWKPIEFLSEDFDAERILIYTESDDITMRYRIVDYQFAVKCKDAIKYIPFNNPNK